MNKACKRVMISSLRRWSDTLCSPSPKPKHTWKNLYSSVTISMGRRIKSFSYLNGLTNIASHHVWFCVLLKYVEITNADVACVLFFAECMHKKELTLLWDLSFLWVRIAREMFCEMPITPSSNTPWATSRQSTLIGLVKTAWNKPVHCWALSSCFGIPKPVQLCAFLIDQQKIPPMLKNQLSKPFVQSSDANHFRFRNFNLNWISILDRVHDLGGRSRQSASTRSKTWRPEKGPADVSRQHPEPEHQITTPSSQVVPFEKSF